MKIIRGWRAIAKVLGMSDSALRKRLSGDSCLSAIMRIDPDDGRPYALTADMEGYLREGGPPGHVFIDHLGESEETENPTA